MQNGRTTERRERPSGISCVGPHECRGKSSRREADRAPVNDACQPCVSLSSRSSAASWMSWRRSSSLGAVRVVERGAVDARCLLEDAAVLGLGQLAGVAGALARQGEGQRLHRAVRRLAARASAGRTRQSASRATTAGRAPRGRSCRGTRNTMPWQQPPDSMPKTRPGLLGRAAVDAAPHLERPVPAMHLGRAPLGEVEIGPPDQRAVAEDPEVFVAAPFLQHPVEHGRGIAQGLEDLVHGGTDPATADLVSTNFSAVALTAHEARHACLRPAANRTSMRQKRILAASSLPTTAAPCPGHDVAARESR